jgi:hypothetical protein
MAARRWTLLEQSVDAALFPPAVSRWPEVEEAVWQCARAAIVGEMSVPRALNEMAARIRPALPSIPRHTYPRHT